MKVLFDHNVNRRFRRHLVGHEIKTTREMGWEQLANGELLRAAADAGFDVLLTVDKNIRFEQNLDQLPLAVCVLDVLSNALAGFLPFAPHVLALLAAPLNRILYVISRDGQVTEFGTPPVP